LRDYLKTRRSVGIGFLRDPGPSPAELEEILTIGVRVPDHPAPRALAAVLGPLPTTSANVSGEPDARDAREIADRLGDALALVLDGGPIHGGLASTVVDCTGERPVIRRVGAIPTHEIARVLEQAGLELDEADA
jgi:tRNA A37 threonylcarbamoyladenosine synthetase subunit TsaC/SUA5/YrdC